MDDPTTEGVDALPRTTELIDYLCPDEDVNLSTASLLSARFPVVSPTGRIAATDCTRGLSRDGLMTVGSTTYVVDGGYLDNSGASTALQAWRALEPLAAAREQAGRGCVVPIFLQIDNSVLDVTGQTATSRPLEVVAPGQALLSQLGGRESMESSEAEQTFGSVRPDRRWPAGVLVRRRKHGAAAGPRTGLVPDRPGRTAGPATRRSAGRCRRRPSTTVRAQLRTKTNAANLAQLIALLRTPMTCPPVPDAPQPAAPSTR